MSGDLLSDLERVAAAQKETLEALESLKRSDEITAFELEEIEERERQINLEIESLTQERRFKTDKTDE